MKSSEDKYGTLPLPYLVCEPEPGENDSIGDRILVYLHGSGDRGASAGNLLTGWGLPKLLANGLAFPFTVVSPVCPENRIWHPEMVNGFLDRLISGAGLFKSRIILSGYSMGATGVYAFQAEYPGKVHGLIPVAGRVTGFSEENMALVPTFAVYGDRDERLVESDIEKRFERIGARGGRAVLRILEGKGHFISDAAYTLGEIKDWIVGL